VRGENDFITGELNCSDLFIEDELIQRLHLIRTDWALSSDVNDLSVFRRCGLIEQFRLTGNDRAVSSNTNRLNDFI
jgi:hypothetical protein